MTDETTFWMQKRTEPGYIIPNTATPAKNQESRHGTDISNEHSQQHAEVSYFIRFTETDINRPWNTFHKSHTIQFLHRKTTK